MPRIFDFGWRDVTRAVTVASLLSQRGSTTPLTQVTAGTAEEAAAAEAAGIEMVVCLSDRVEAVREGSTYVFVTAAIDFSAAVSDDELLREAYEAIRKGADAVITGRRPQSVSRLAEEEIPVLGHLGFVPNRSTWYGGIRAVGKTANEAMQLWDRFRRLEDAGAIGVECELIPAKIMREINERTGLITVSLGSGPDADVIFLFTSDICGESERLPRHARPYCNLSKLQEEIRSTRIRGLKAFRADVTTKAFPSESEIAAVDEEEVEKFVELLEGYRHK